MVINVKANNHNYDVVIEKGALALANKYFNLERKVLIVTDSNIPLTYIETVKKQCKEAYIFTFEAGEKSKNFDTYQNILTALFENNFSRKDVVVAIGGGVTGDMAGFAASTYMRGIDFYNIPTTFLSMADSSIGGKTAIDFNGVKNLVGAFYPPMGVLIDVDVLKTLSPREIAAGLAESIKMSLTSSKELFELLDNSTDFENDVEEIIYKSLLIKKMVVEEDEKEAGLRQILNFGHTIGHAIEANSNGMMLHGECVALGMTYFVSKNVKQNLLRVLTKYNLPTYCVFNKEDIIKLIAHDKKASNELVNVIRVNEIGSYEIVKMSISEMEAIL